MIVRGLGFSSRRMAITIATMDLIVVTLQWLLWQQVVIVTQQLVLVMP
jgi:hypothetical protein